MELREKWMLLLLLEQKMDAVVVVVVVGDVVDVECCFNLKESYCCRPPKRSPSFHLNETHTFT